jgi:seryl-tRNA synthetase
MKGKLATLNLLRKQIENQKFQVEKAEEVLEASAMFLTIKSLKEHLADLEVEADELADEIREDALLEFDLSEDKNKKPYDGIQIKEFQTIEVTDEEEAIKWSIDSGQFALVSLVTSKFNKIAKVLDLPFVTKGTEYRAQIASDLSMYEEKDE